MDYRLLTLITLFLFILTGTILWPEYGLLFTGLFSFFTAPLWSEYFMDRSKVTKASLRRNMHDFLFKGYMRLIFLIFINVIVVLMAGWNTLIDSLFVIYGVASFLGYCFAYFKKLITHLYVISFGIAPSVISVFLILNYTISFSPYKETYSYFFPANHEANTWDDDMLTMMPRIILKDHAYGEFIGMRTFFNKDQISGGKITYTFETGLLGFAVVKEYNFHR